MKQIRTTRQFKNGVDAATPQTLLPRGSDASTPGVGRCYPGGRTQDRHCAARRAFVPFGAARQINQTRRAMGVRTYGTSTSSTRRTGTRWRS